MIINVEVPLYEAETDTVKETSLDITIEIDDLKVLGDLV